MPKVKQKLQTFKGCLVTSKPFCSSNCRTSTFKTSPNTNINSTTYFIVAFLIVSIWAQINSANHSTTNLNQNNQVKTNMATLDNLTKEQVIPDVIDVKPSASINITWPSGVTAQQGNELKPTQVKDQPEIVFDAKPDKLYTLAMVDPDPPSRAEPSLREILHFMVANIPANQVAKGDTFAEYIGSGPPEKTGLHRYVFLVFEQKEKLKSDLMKISKTSRVGRVKFSIRKFAKDHGLGDPIAANFYQAQYDDYVPKLHAQLSSG